jgi:hypothetical protein
MAKIVTNSLKVYNAKQFINSLSSVNDRKLFLFIARSEPWPNEFDPPVPNDKPTDFFNWDDIIALKRITSSDVKHVVPRIDWSPGTVFQEYDDALSDLFDKQFYVKNSQNNVYKCISNNYGTISTQEPTGKSLNYFTTSDNYKWKYMYSIDDSDELRFLTREYMPVNRNQDVVNSARNGTIENFKLLNLGSNYSNVANLTVSVIGNGSNAALTPFVSSSNTIIGFTIGNPGINYTFANVRIQGGNGSGANARAIISPQGGHGKDALSELGAYRVMINTRLDFAEGSGDFPVTNDYRTIGIIEAPLDYSTGEEAVFQTYDGTYKMNVTSISGAFQVDEYLIGSNSRANAQIITTGSGSRFDIKYLQYSRLSNSHINFRVGETVIGTVSSATANIMSLTPPEVVRNTGKILYLENRRRISRASDQSENIHIVIEF